MTFYVHLITGIGSPKLSSTYFGPLNGRKEMDAFLENIRMEFGRMHDTSTMSATFILPQELPRNRKVFPSETFFNFVKS
jgi:hypothetical protein